MYQSAKNRTSEVTSRGQYAKDRAIAVKRFRMLNKLSIECQRQRMYAYAGRYRTEAQLIKHDFRGSANAIAYEQSTVGKIYLVYNARAEEFSCFSPFIEGAHLRANIHPLGVDVVAEKLLDDKSVLIYISKFNRYSS